jgi:PhoPQ-activated pathogenicity-related protein
MFFRKRLTAVLALCAFAASLIATSSSADLQSYVGRPETAFEWQVKNKTDRESGELIYDLQFVSQVWQGKKWRHQLQIYRPAESAPSATMFLWVTGETN